jgi:hypothetical protein
MYLPPVFELSLVGIADRGVPNHERIVLRPTEAVFGVALGVQSAADLATPVIDQFFWFGELVVSPPSWVVIYTGPGEFQESRDPQTGQLVYAFHWGKPSTVFTMPKVVPIVFRMSGVLLGPPPPANQQGLLGHGR